jgi:hypothetical protein
VDRKAKRGKVHFVKELMITGISGKSASCNSKEKLLTPELNQKKLKRARSVYREVQNCYHRPPVTQLIFRYLKRNQRPWYHQMMKSPGKDVPRKIKFLPSYLQMCDDDSYSIGGQAASGYNKLCLSLFLFYYRHYVEHLLGPNYLKNAD